MRTFQQPPKESPNVFLEDTDRPLPEVLNPSTRYMPLGEIAKGGKSLIMSMKDRHLARVVAYKTLRPEFVHDPIEQRRLLREARVSAMLQHPNTMPVYELGRDRKGNYYFTMKFVHGYTLRQLLDFRDRYDLTQLVEVIEQIALALAYAHSRRVAHRDIKPENILAGPYGEVLLLDWGLAKVWNKDGTSTDAQDQELTQDLSHGDKSMTGHGKLQGTLCHMSPEQIRRDPDIGVGTDVYSLGTVLYEVLTGQPPFDSDKTYEVLDWVEHKEPAKPSRIAKYPVPRLLERLCMQCLRKNPAERPTMKDMVGILHEDWASDLIVQKRKG